MPSAAPTLRVTPPRSPMPILATRMAVFCCPFRECSWWRFDSSGFKQPRAMSIPISIPIHCIGSVPEELRDSVERWWERASAQDGFLNAYQALDESHRAQLPRVVAASEFVASALIQDPQSLGWFSQHDALTSKPTNAGYESQAATASTAEQAQFALREWRRRA